MKFIFFILLAFYSVLITFGQDTIYKKFYYPNNQISSEGQWVNNHPAGYWKSYYPTGVLKSEGKRRNNELDSIWVFYTEKGYIKEKISYKFGKKNGFHITYFQTDSINSVNSVIKSKELYLNDLKEGWSFYFYPSGKLYQKIYYENGKKDGESFRYAENDGRLLLKLEYNEGLLTNSEILNRYNEQGQKVGSWKSFYENGKLKSESFYENGKLQGLKKDFKASGELQIAFRYDDGKLIEEVAENSLERNIVSKYYEDGTLKSEGFYLDSLPVGIHSFFDKNGEVKKSVIYDDSGNKLSEGIIDKGGAKQGVWKNFYSNGSLKSTGKFVNSKKEGLWNFYFKNSKIEQKGTYKNNRFQGEWIWFYEDGSVWKEENFVNGKNEGYFVEYSREDEILQEGEYFDGLKEGMWTYKVGDHIEKGEYISGLKNSEWNYYYLDGSIHFEGNYIQGAPDGKHYIYYPNGIIKEERNYVMGYKEKTWKKYYPNGELYMTITYDNDKEVKINGFRIN